ncbi:MAG: polyphosphate kinase 1 [Gammaproteobacteria bacterium]
MDTENLGLPDYYINRELSLLEFNKRVLAQALDRSTPLLERLRFLCISCTNLDEFFEIRVSGLKQREELGSAAPGPDRMTPRETLTAIRTEAGALVEEQYRLLNDDLIPELADNGVHFVRRDAWSSAQSQWLHSYFREQVLPVLTPLTLDPSRPFPRILNKSLNFIVALKGKDVFGRRRHRGLVQAPRSLPRLIPLPAELGSEGEEHYVFLSSVIHSFVEELFPGMKVDGCFQFRVTRNSDLYVDDEEVDDLVRALEGELAASRYGAAVRLEVASECPDELNTFLLDHFELTEEDLYRVDGPVNLNRLLRVADLSEREDLKFRPFTAGLPVGLVAADTVFDAVDNKDILLHHPFQSFTPVIDFIAQAATDPDVLAIKQTLYRSGPTSPIVDHLVTAAQTGKEVTVVIELMARFDEAANIALANRLQEAGAHVVYGVVGYKTHAKMALVVRRYGEELRRYVHLGTGNYHPQTTRVYTDYGLLSSDQSLGRDVHEVFMQLTSLTEIRKLERITTAPFRLHDRILALIAAETEAAEAGEPARIIVKVNALIEPQVIQALYRASRAGVQIDLIVRGICSLRPGLPGLSDNIRVRSIVGRFLEHSRVYYFHAGGRETIYCASADWMERNFFNRVECCFPLLRKSHRSQVKSDLELYLADNTDAWELAPDGSYRRLRPEPGENATAAQTELLQRLAETC